MAPVSPFKASPCAACWVRAGAGESVLALWILGRRADFLVVGGFLNTCMAFLDRRLLFVDGRRLR
jgi:hypothetical protein